MVTNKKYKKLLQEFNELMSDRNYYKGMVDTNHYKLLYENSNLQIEELEKELAYAESAFDLAQKKLKDGLESLDKSRGPTAVIRGE
jgi:hypothetical protein